MSVCVIDKIYVSAVAAKNGSKRCGPVTTTEIGRRPGIRRRMYEAYFTKRLLEALTLADEAADADERSVHLQASRYYRNLLQFPEKRHSIRHRTHIPATLCHVGNRPRRIVVSDLSTGGFRMTFEEPLQPGRPILLEMDGFAPIYAYVVWQDSDQVGCTFVQELHPAIVDAAVAVSSRG